MTHPPRFFQNILARPDDDTPRLRYANWLDGCGNPLGEFIRLQCGLANHPAGAPLLQYERRAQELLARHRIDWSQALAKCVHWCSFRRGFVEEIALTDRQLHRHAADVFAHAPVLDLHLHWLGLKLNKLPELPGVSHTIFLDVSSQRLGNGCIERLADAPFLQRVHGLNLGSNNLGDEGLDALHDSPHLGKLRELYLNDNPISDDGIRRFVMSPLVERLDVLDVRFTHISRESVEVLKRILSEKVLVGNSFA